MHKLIQIEKALKLLDQYVGVVIGKDIIYRDGKIRFDKFANVDNSFAKTSTAPDEVVERIIRNTYNALLKRGMRGTLLFNLMIKQVSVFSMILVRV